MTGSYTDKNVKIGKKYYYKVVTYKNISGGKCSVPLIQV